MEFAGDTHLVRVGTAAVFLPACCVQMVLTNVPAVLSVEELPRVVLELAGYAVRDPPPAGEPLVPDAAAATLCQIRPGLVAGGGYDAGFIVATLVPPLGDPCLRLLPPSMVVGFFFCLRDVTSEMQASSREAEAKRDRGTMGRGDGKAGRKAGGGD